MRIVTNLEHEARDRRDIEIINRNAERLNQEAEGTLEYQQVQNACELHAAY